MEEKTLNEMIENCASEDFALLITDCRSVLTEKQVKRILERVISAYVIYVVRRLNKYDLLRREHNEIVMRKCPTGYQHEVEMIFMTLEK